MARGKSTAKATPYRKPATPPPLGDADEWMVASVLSTWAAIGSTDGELQLDEPHVSLVSGFLFLAFGWKKSYAEGENAIGFW